MKKLKNKKKRRDIIIGVRFNAYEFKRLEKSCDWVGRSMSDFIRRAVLKRLRDTRPAESVELSEEKTQLSQQ